MSVSEQIEPVTLQDMKASIGSILLLWSSVERELTQRIEALSDGQVKNGAHTISQKISRWKDLQAIACAERPEHKTLLTNVHERLTQALDIRNRIAHGLIGIAVDPFGHRGDAGLETEMNGEKRILRYGELEHLMRVLSHLKWAIVSLSDAAIQKDPRKAENAYAGMRLNHLP